MSNFDDDDDDFLYGTSSKAQEEPKAGEDSARFTFMFSEVGMEYSGGGSSYDDLNISLCLVYRTNITVLTKTLSLRDLVVPQSTISEQAPEPPSPIVAQLEAQAESASATPSPEIPQQNDAAPTQNSAQEEEEEEEEEEEIELGDSDSEDEDIEIIMEPQTRSLDFRQNKPGARTMSSSHPAPPKAPAPQSSLTTEYTPIARGSDLHPSASQPPASTQAPKAQATSTEPPAEPEDDGVDTSTLPPVAAPPSHPSIDATAVGVLDGRSILEVDLSAMGEKPWRRPGSDISDWFNYGFDEISWEAYCYRRRDLGEMADVLKTNVINFSGIQEDQLTNLPPEVRQMVMTGTTAMMNNAGNNNMMGPGVMMDMSNMNMMGAMGNGMGMGMGMGGEMGMPGAMMQMQDGAQAGVVGANGAGEQVGGNVGMMQDGFGAGQAQQGMIGMGMGGEFGMQENPQMNQQMYQGMDNQTPNAPTPVVGTSQRGPTPAGGYRGRGGQQGMMRGRGYPARGRGRGGYAGEGGPPVPVRPASPLPPNVPTGPRNQNKYKDRDGNAPAVDGLDYGGTNKDFGRTPSGEPEDRGNRKRRSSPGLDESRGSKRR